MIDAGSTTLNNKWKKILHNQAEDYIIPESNVNVMCPYDCLSTSGYTVSSYSPESICNPNTLASAPTTINRDKKIATFEWNFWVLDGSFEVLDTGETYNGYMSSNISGADCTFSVNPYVFLDHLTFNQRKNQTIKFAPAYNQVPAEIELFTAYGSTVNSIIYDIEEMLEQDDIQNQEYVHLYSDDVDTTFSASRVGITTRKTLMPYRRARVTEYNNGYKFFKDKFDLLSFTHTRTVSMNMSELPQNNLQISFTDFEGIYDTNNNSKPFYIKLNNSNLRFYVYYGYNFDDIGWNYVLVDTLCYDDLDINYDSIETVLSLKSTLLLHSQKYPTSTLSSSTSPYNWNTFEGFITAIKTISGMPTISYSGYSHNSMYRSAHNAWRTLLIQTTKLDGEFSKTPCYELLQQILSILNYVLVRQPNTDLVMKDTLGGWGMVDTFEPDNIISSLSNVEVTKYKDYYFETPKSNDQQEDDRDINIGSGSLTIMWCSSRKLFNGGSYTGGTENTSITQCVLPLGEEGNSNYWNWEQHESYFEGMVYGFDNYQCANRYELQDTFINPLLEVADLVGVDIGNNYSRILGHLEKIEINYDGSFRGSIQIASI